jgi:hypothetical protein
MHAYTGRGRAATRVQAEQVSDLTHGAPPARACHAPHFFSQMLCAQIFVQKLDKSDFKCYICRKFTKQAL